MKEDGRTALDRQANELTCRMFPQTPGADIRPLGLAPHSRRRSQMNGAGPFICSSVLDAGLAIAVEVSAQPATLSGARL